MLTVNTSAIKVVNNRLTKMKERAKYPKKAMDIIGAKAWKDVLNSFTIEQNEDGKKWKPLKYRKGKPLRDKGFLFGSITWITNNTEARIFTKKKYAKYHDSDKPRTKLPRRQFMWVNAKLKVKFLTDLLQFIKG